MEKKRARRATAKMTESPRLRALRLLEEAVAVQVVIAELIYPKELARTLRGISRMTVMSTVMTVNITIVTGSNAAQASLLT